MLLLLLVVVVVAAVGAGSTDDDDAGMFGWRRSGDYFDAGATRARQEEPTAATTAGAPVLRA